MDILKSFFNRHKPCLHYIIMSMPQNYKKGKLQELLQIIKSNIAAQGRASCMDRSWGAEAVAGRTKGRTKAIGMTSH